jgi:hypothetical protein
MRRRTIHLVMGLALAVAGCGRRAEEGGPTPGPASPAPAGSPAEPAARSASSPADPWAWTPAPAGPPRVLVTAIYADGYVSGLADDRDLKVGEGFFRLSQLRRWRRAGTGEILRADGPPVAGNLAGLDRVEVTVGGAVRDLDLTRASDVLFEAPEALAPAPGLDAIRQGRFLRPFFSLRPVTSFRSVRLGDRKIDVFEDTERIRINNGGTDVLKLIEVQMFGDQTTPPRNLSFADPSNRTIEIGKLYERYKPFSSASVLKFVVWEAEISKDPEARDPSNPTSHPFDKLAVDYEDRDRETRFGSIRVNSSYR